MTPSYVDRVAAFFQAQPNTWISALDLESVGGRQGWRTRVSDARRQHQMVIENRVRRTASGVKLSEYRYRPAGDQQEVSS